VALRVLSLHFVAPSLYFVLAYPSPCSVFILLTRLRHFSALAGARIPAGKEVAKAALLAKQGASASASSSKHASKAAAAEAEDEEEDDEDEDVVMTNASSKKNAKAMSAAGRAALASGML
jgi:hypothetical protein